MRNVDARVRNHVREAGRAREGRGESLLRSAGTVGRSWVEEDVNEVGARCRFVVRRPPRLAATRG